ncbi:MAG: lysophospholipase [Oscillospiraceae bacterium]|nr:lysophospholipase [Oscillospiraceae bacterium]
MIITANGVRLFFEKQGQGRPVILLHGNSENHGIFRRLARELADDYTVYALDTRGHGKSQRVKELHYADMAADVAAFIHALRLEDEKSLLYGFSDGGIVGLLVAGAWPGLLGGLAVSGASLNPQSTTDGMLRLMRWTYRLTRSAKFKLMLEEPDITAADLAKITVPTLVLAGQNDMIKEEHTRRIAAGIAGSKLQILPGESHTSYVINSPKLAPLLRPFFAELPYKAD